MGSKKPSNRIVLNSGLAVVAAVGALLSSTTAASAVTVTAADTCQFSNTLCAWDQVEFTGAKFTAKSLTPPQGVCVDLAAHGWGGRIKSAINTNPRAATLYTNSNCTGTPQSVPGSGSRNPVTILANSVFVF